MTLLTVISKEKSRTKPQKSSKSQAEPGKLGRRPANCGPNFSKKNHDITTVRSVSKLITLQHHKFSRSIRLLLKSDAPNPFTQIHGVNDQFLLW
jgi:hypothetical protein